MKDQALVDTLATLALPASGTVYTRARPVRSRVSVVAAWTGTPTGAFRVQVSFDGGTSWYDAPGYATQFTSGGNLQPAGGASAAVWTFLDLPGGLWRVAYAATSGTGSAVLTYSMSDAMGAYPAPAATIGFRTAIPFRGRLLMPQTVAPGPLAFSIAGTATAGSETVVRLVSNGANTPTFTGFIEHGSSMGWNGLVGIVNIVTFWFDGYDYWYSIAQAVSPVAVPVVVPGDVLRFSYMLNAAESGDGTNGYNYTFGAGSPGQANSPSKTLAASGDGWIKAQVGAFAGHSAFLGWAATSANEYFGSMLYALFVSSGSGKYAPISGGTQPGANTNANVVGAVGDIVRSRRVGSNIYAEVSKDAGLTWTVVHLYTATSAKLWPVLAAADAAIFNNARSLGLA